MSEFNIILLEQLISKSEDDTFQIGRRIASYLKGGEFIGIEGNLGSGKTVFVKGLAVGIGVNTRQVVDSPTFKLVNTYRGTITLHHVDLYRLETVEDIINIGFFDLLMPDCVIAVEWAEKLKSLKMDYEFYIKLLNISDTEREIKIFGKSRSA